MYLKRLEIHGFKTFASHTTFEFRPGITAIIGPNGSGKSNAADAVRWVLGEQSHATLRSKRTEDIIFSGGGKRAPSGFAEVSLTIDNSDRLLPLPYGEVTITRRATRAGENEYSINRSRVRLRDIHEAVGPLGGSYTIINQGLVDAALTLRPEERRRLFEDAADIGTYVARKSDAESKLRETSANMERSTDLLSELEPRLRSLKRQATAARNHRELSDELRELLLRHYTHAYQTARRALAQAEIHEATGAADLEARRGAQAAATSELRLAREAVRELRERLGKLHNESSGLHARAAHVQRDLAVGGERLAALSRREEDAERSRHELANRYEELERERSAITARLDDAQVRLAAARAAVDDHSTAQASQEQELRAARQRLDSAARDEAAVTAAAAALARRAEQLTERRTALQAEQTSQSNGLQTTEATLARHHAALAGVEAALTAAQATRAAAASSEEQARAEIERLRAERGRADDTLAATRRALADQEARLESLTRLQRSFAGSFAGVKAAMQWAEAQRRAGFVLVSSLLRTPPHLDTAIEVALGSRIQNIVVETWQDAEEAIGALKKNGSGRATFLPLDSIKRQGAGGRNAPAELSPGVLGIAAELVEYDHRYRDVVWSLIGRTLIVDHLATARHALRTVSGNWSIVTLAGEQVNSSGALTGGAQIKEAGVLRRERELRELPAQVDAARQVADERARERATLEAGISVAERAAREAEANRRRVNGDLEQSREAERTARREVERAENALDLQRRRVEQIAVDLVGVESQQEALLAEHASLEQQEQQVRIWLNELRTADAVRANEELAAQTRLAELRAVAAAVEGELRTERALIQSHDQQFRRLDIQRAEIEQRGGTLANERAAAAAQLATLETAHTKLLAEIDGLHELISPAEAELAALEANRATNEQRESELTAALLAHESAHGRAALDTIRARDRLDTLWERAAADDIDVEQLPTHDDTTFNVEELASQITALRSRIARLGAVNPLALEEYEESNTHYQFMTTQLADLQHAADALRELIGELDGAMTARFETTFASISAEFERCFVRLFGGGEAKLFLTNNAGVIVNGDGEGNHGNITDLGIDITVRPPGKRQQNISLLSGGERALTASALLFAILTVNPTPFCILDEVDAALDEANVGRFRAMLADLAAQTQFLLVTHNRGTIEVADTIYGVSMLDDGASRVLSVRLEELGVE